MGILQKTSRINFNFFRLQIKLKKSPFSSCFIAQIIIFPICLHYSVSHQNGGSRNISYMLHLVATETGYRNEEAFRLTDSGFKTIFRLSQLEGAKAQKAFLMESLNKAYDIHLRIWHIVKLRPGTFPTAWFYTSLLHWKLVRSNIIICHS